MILTHCAAIDFSSHAKMVTIPRLWPNSNISSIHSMVKVVSFDSVFIRVTFKDLRRSKQK